MARREQALLALSIGLLAGAALAYQVLLFRLLAIVQWHTFIVTIVSLALLGHGAAGTALALAGRRLLPRFPTAYASSAALFAVTAPACWALAQQLPFNGLELVWNPVQLGWLAGLFLLLALPFFFAACSFGLAFMHSQERIAVLYAADLVGAGLGAGIATGLLFLLPAEEALRIAAIAGAIAAVLPEAPRIARFALPALAMLGIITRAALVACAAHHRVQGTAAGACGNRRGGRGRVLESLWAPHDGPQRAGPLPACTGPQPRRDDRGSGTARCVHGRRWNDGIDRLGRAPGVALLARRDDHGTSLPAHCAPSRAGARRGRRRRSTAGDLPRRTGDTRCRTQPGDARTAARFVARSPRPFPGRRRARLRARGPQPV